MPASRGLFTAAATSSVDRQRTMQQPGRLSIMALSLLCPFPVLKARARLKSMRPGQVLRLLASDPAVIIDVPHFCTESGNELVAIEETGGGTRAYLIRRT
jgi:tRNA 2-thiouridine synthesizing protein A